MPRATRLILVIAGWLFAAPIDAFPPGSTSSLPSDRLARTDRYGDPLPEGAVARLGTMRYRPGPCGQASLSRDGKWLATGDEHWRKIKRDRRVTLWEMSGGRAVAKIDIPGSTEIVDLHFRTDGKQLAVVARKEWTEEGSERRREWICLVDVQTQAIVNQLSVEQLEHNSPGRISHFDSARGMLFQSYSSKQTGVIDGGQEEDEDDEPEPGRRQDAPLFLWQPEANKLFRLFSQHEEFFAVPGGRVLSLLGDQIRLIDPTNRRVLSEWVKPSRASSPRCVSPDGKTLVVHRPKKVRGPGKAIRESCETLLCEANKQPRVIDECKTRWFLDDYSFSSDGRYLLALHNRCLIKVWNVAAGKLLWESDVSKHLRVSYLVHPDARSVVLLHHGPAWEQINGSTVRLHGSCLQLIDLQTGKVLSQRTDTGAENADWTPDGKHLVVIGATVRFLGAKHLEVERTPPFHGHADRVESIRHSPNQRWIACQDGHGLWIWDRSGAKCVIRADPPMLQSVWEYAFVDGGDLVATITMDGARLQVYRCSTEAVVYDVPFATSRTDRSADMKNDMPASVHAAEFSPDGSRLVVTVGAEVQLWDTRLGKCIARQACQNMSAPEVEFCANARLIFVRKGEKAIAWNSSLSKEIGVLDDVGREPFSFSADGDRFAYRHGDHQIDIWNIRQRRSIFTYHLRTEDYAEFYLFPTGDRLAIYRDGAIRVVDVRTGRELRAIGDVERVTFPAVADKSHASLLANVRNEAEDHALIDLETGRTVIELAGVNPVWAMSPDGRIVAHGLDDVTLVEVATGMEIGTIPGQQGGVSSLAFSPDGRTLTTGGPDTTALVWEWSSACRLWTNEFRQTQEAWARLRTDNARQAYSAMLALESSPREALALLRRELRPASADEFRRIRAWIAQLDDDSYAVRNRATRELSQRGRMARALLEEAYKRPRSLEAENRLRVLLASLATGLLSPDELRQLRAIQLLEWLNTPEARDLLRSLADGEPAALSTREAKAALQRFGGLQQ